MVFTPETISLIKLLCKNDIPFDIYIFDAFETLESELTVQILSPSFDNVEIDAMTLSEPNGLLEVLIRNVGEDEKLISDLTAEEAFKFFKERYDETRRDEY